MASKKVINLITSLLKRNSQELLQKGWMVDIDGRPMQCVVCEDGTYFFCFNEPLDIPMLDEGQSGMPQIWYYVRERYRSNAIATAYSLPEIKEALKRHRSGEDKALRCEWEQDKKWFDAKLLVNVLDVLGKETIWYKDPSPLAPDMFRSDVGIALLCPLNPKMVRANRKREAAV